jgi:hypothetical protein
LGSLIAKELRYPGYNSIRAHCVQLRLLQGVMEEHSDRNASTVYLNPESRRSNAWGILSLRSTGLYARA